MKTQTFRFDSHRDVLVLFYQSVVVLPMGYQDQISNGHQTDPVFRPFFHLSARFVGFFRRRNDGIAFYCAHHHRAYDVDCRHHRLVEIAFDHL